MRNIVTDIRASVFKMRGGIWTALFLSVWFLAEPPGMFRAFFGLLLVVLGQLLRFWAAGCIIRYRGENVGAARLTTWGPYGIVRNPLYVANWFIGAGWGVLAGWKALFLFIVAFWILYCTFIVPHEEEYLSKRFGDEYTRYLSSTGRFFPRTFSQERLRGPFDSSVLWRSERYSFYITLAGTLLLLFFVR